MSFILDDSDPSIQYSIGDWTPGGIDLEFKATTHGTTAANAFATIPFSGTYIEVFGTIAAQGTRDHRPLLLQSPQIHLLLYTKPVFFASPTLPDGNHTLVVQTTVQGGQVWLDFFQFTPSSVTTTTPTGSTNSGESDNDNSASPKSSPQVVLNVGAIVGAALGSVAVTLLFCFILFFFWKRRRLIRDRYTRSQFMMDEGATDSPTLSYTAFAPQQTPVAASEQPFVPDYGYGHQSPPVNPSYTPALNPSIVAQAVNPRSEKSIRLERERNIPPSYTYDGIGQ
ncbi:hypothetical protein C8J56DRAFT_1126626 [Mycena floridula]|nr:hypothetical protein C8J56DRAFT_1126626 [Mycena floridula]